jgi:hypothetical protein
MIWEDIQGGSHISWTVICPHCGDEHTHGAAQGYRVSPCEGDGYLLRAPEGWMRRSGVAEREPTTLYRFYHGPRLLYVGITGNVRHRVNQHSGEKPWWQETTYATMEHFDCREDAAWAEKKAIEDEHPRYNIVHNRSRPWYRGRTRGRNTVK